ncbi:hypothetical protein L0664_17300 [Octadecabacter sp. G9-8]|uniref:Lipoprotein n=1 Tax=Octadecabacter dasysiphoniae TaxID=2909341 RepID=A0ABS9D1A9_9RHOB|nr:hypothetical protein [Octadecabacter dasysiphoniae]MCF2872827.1 hypothetical protein [Octadecabacter dasysiphoniae]
MRAIVLTLGLALAGCSEFPTSRGAPGIGEVQGSAAQAYFTGYPARLFFVAEELCNGPGQSVVKPSRNQVRCESLPDPESAAAIILQYGGTVEALPKLVIAFSGRNTADGYLMTVDNYIRVPQRDGGAQQVRFVDQQVTDSLAELLATAGGRPL